MTNEVQEKGSRYHALTETQKASNREKASHRARVAHIFGYMANLTYNLMRSEMHAVEQESL